MEKNKNTNLSTGPTSVSGTGRGAAVRKAFAHPPMPIELHAKQFMPFAAVTGLEKALREKEQERERNER